MLQAYPLDITPNGVGGYIAQFPDVPSAMTEAASREEALYWAQDALLVALSGYLDEREDIPQPSKPKPGQPAVTLPLLATIKLAIYQAMRAQGLSQAGLARRMGCDSRQVRRLIDLDHNSRLDLMENALKALGKNLVLDIDEAA